MLRKLYMFLEKVCAFLLQYQIRLLAALLYRETQHQTGQICVFQETFSRKKMHYGMFDSVLSEKIIYIFAYKIKHCLIIVTNGNFDHKLSPLKNFAVKNCLVHKHQTYVQGNWNKPTKHSAFIISPVPNFVNPIFQQLKKIQHYFWIENLHKNNFKTARYIDIFIISYFLFPTTSDFTIFFCL